MDGLSMTQSQLNILRMMHAKIVEYYDHLRAALEYSSTDMATIQGMLGRNQGWYGMESRHG